MIKKFFLFIIVFSILTSCIIHVSALAVDTSGECVILMEADSKDILYEKNSDEKMLIASITKVLTALVVLENSNLTDKVEIKYEYCTVEGSSMYLNPGETVSVHELLYGLLLVSGNDAATALAYHISGNIADFADLMNSKASELGMTNSGFKNPHGLNEEGHYSTAKDVALLMAAAMENEEFVKIVSTKTITVNGRTMKNHNRLLWEYDGIIGGKTGYTQNAGRTLVTCAQRDGLRLVCVTLNDSDDWNDHKNLYDWGFSEYRCEVIAEAGKEYCSIDVISGTEEKVSVFPDKSYNLHLQKDDIYKVEVHLPGFVYSDIYKGDHAGQLIIKVNGKMYDSIDLIFGETVLQDKPTNNIFRNIIKSNATFLNLQEN